MSSDAMDASPRVVWMPGAVRTEIRLDGHDTGGAFCLLVDQPPSGWSLPPHLHHGAAETVHIVEGEFEMEVAGQLFVWAPDRPFTFRPRRSTLAAMWARWRAGE